MAIEVSKTGIAEASQNLLSCATELSDVFDNLQQVTNSIGTNLTGISQVEQLLDILNQVNSNKDIIVSKIKEFANYLTTNVNPGYDAFKNLFSGITVGGTFLENLFNLFGSDSLGGNSFDGNVEGEGQQSQRPSGGGGGSGGRFPGKNDSTGNEDSDDVQQDDSIAELQRDAHDDRVEAQTEFFNNPTSENRDKYNEALLHEAAVNNPDAIALLEERADLESENVKLSGLVASGDDVINNTLQQEENLDRIEVIDEQLKDMGY